MINRIKGYFEEVDGDKYLIISSENDYIMQKYQEISLMEEKKSLKK